MLKFNQVYHPFILWEEYHHGMWRLVYGKERDQYRQAAADLMKNPLEFFQAMKKATEEWKYSCEANLTSPSTNKLAWLGHAGCCIKTDSPEDITRQAWHTLNQKEQDEANRVALDVLKIWEKQYQKELKAGDKRQLSFLF